MASLFNATTNKISYISKDNSAVVTFSSGSGESINMLVESAQAQLQRGASLRHFLNSGPALLLGKGQGSLTLTGLFGTAEQLSALCGTASDPCSIKRNIKLSAGVLEQCDDAAKTVSTADIILQDCVVQSFSINVSLQQDGTTFQQATVNFLITDASLA